jgi:hypothetical protein
MSDSDKTDSSHESGKNVIIWAWPTSTTIIWNNPVLQLLGNWKKLKQKHKGFIQSF